MKKTVTKSMFIDSFNVCNREHNFSYEGRGALFEYLERLEEDTETEMELDPIAICCDFVEYETATKAIEDCGYNVEHESEDDDEKEEQAADFLRDNTTLIEFAGGVIFQQF